MKNNKGFSLVELIIVIAIMAILVGVMAPQLIKYIEKSKISSDTQLCDTVRTAITTTVMDPSVINNTAYSMTPGGEVQTIANTVMKKSVCEIIGTTDPNSQLKSSTAKQTGLQKIKYTIIDGNQITVYVGSGIGAGPATSLIGTLAN